MRCVLCIFRRGFFVSLFSVAAHAASELQVVNHFPVGEVASRGASDAVTVTFNQPMVTLSDAKQTSEFCPLSITPAVAGRCRWVGTQTLQIQPAEKLPRGTFYIAEVPSGTASKVSGAVLRQKETWSFTTQRPAVTLSRPHDDERWVSLSPVLFVQFNMDMDPKKAQPFIAVEEEGTGVVFSVGVRRASDEELKKAHIYLNPSMGISSSSVLAIKPSRTLKMEQAYVLRLKKDLPGAEGPAGLLDERTIRFETYGPFSVKPLPDPDCLPGKFRLGFSNPVRYQNVLDHLSVNTSTFIPTAQWNAEWTGSQEGHVILHPLPLTEWKPDHTYVFTVRKGLTDIFGQALKETVEVTVKAGPYCPDIQSPRGFGVLESYLPPRHPVTVLNIPEVPVEMQRIATDEVIPFLSRVDFWNNKQNESLSSPLRKKWSSRAPRNRRWRTHVDLNEVLHGQGGFAYSQLYQTDASVEWREGWIKSFDNVTRLGLTFKSSPDSTFIWTSYLKTGAPAPHVPVELRDAQNQVLWKGVTNAQGFADGPGWRALHLSWPKWQRPKLWVLAREAHGDAALSSEWKEGLEPWRFNIPYDGWPKKETYAGSVFTERGVYRPGETVHVKGIVRQLKQGDWAPSPQKPLALSLIDARGADVYQSTVTLSPSASFDWAYALPEEAPTGFWRVKLTEPGRQKPFVQAVSSYEDDGSEEDREAVDASQGEMELSASFRVEAFKPAAFEVLAKPDQEAYLTGETFRAAIDAWYLFGAPMAGGEADWKLRLEPAGHFVPKGWDEFDFSSGWWTAPYAPGGRLIGSSKEKLDAKGHATVNAALDASFLQGPGFAVLEASVMSPDRQRLFGRAQAMVHAAELYVGLKSSSHFLDTGKPWEAQVVAVRPSGQTVLGRTLSAELIRRDWMSVQRAGFGGRLEWSNEQRDTVVSSFTFTSGPTPYVWKTTPQKPGHYFFKVSGSDERNRAAASALSFYVMGKGDSWWAHPDTDLLELVPDKTTYKPGDIARILVKSPYSKSRALITVEREGVIDRWLTTLDGGAAFVKVPIKENYLPNIYVGVMLVQGRSGTDQFEKESGGDLAKPEAKFGYAQLMVDPKGRRLAVRIKSNKADYRPGQNVDAFLTLTDETGKPVAGEATVFAVDEGVLALTAYATPDPFSQFYGPRPLSVDTVDSRLHIIGQRNFGEKGESRGGGGGSGAGLQGIDLRSRFVPTAYWNPTVKTGVDGKARVSFTLPDNLSRFRLMAVAHAANRFGSGDSALTVSKPFMARPSLPRFARVGDTFQGGVTLHNYTASAVDAVVEMDVTGSAIAIEGGPARRTVKLGAGKAVETLWTCKAAALGEATFRFRASAGAETDGLEWKIPVKPFERLETVATSGVADTQAVERLARPSSKPSAADQLTLSLSPTAMAGLQEGARYLLEYPYGCLEQRMSSAWPVIVGKDFVDTFQLGSLDQLKKKTQQSFDRLAAYQHPTGGFGYWPSPYLPDPYLTAYALEVSTLAAREGYRIPKEVTAKAVTWLKTYLSDRREWAYPYSESESFAARAYAVYVLSLYGQPPSNYFMELYNRRDQLPYLGKAYLLKAASYSTRDATVKKTLTQELFNQAKVSPTTMHFEDTPSRMPWLHASSVQATSLVLQTLLETQGGFPQDAKVVEWLTRERKIQGRWRSTQDNAWSLRAFQDYFRRYEKEEPAFTSVVRVKDKTPLWTETFAGRTLNARLKTFALSDVLASSKETDLLLTKEGRGRLYYTLRMRYSAEAFKSPVSEGMTIQKTVTPLYGSGELKAGSRAVVTLKVSTPQDRTFVAIDDPMPGGYEIVDTSFATESREEARRSTQEGAFGPYWGTFQRSEKYDDRMQVFADYLATGEHTYSYLIQATTPGKFHSPAATIEQMYEPEVFGRTASSEVTIKK